MRGYCLSNEIEHGKVFNGAVINSDRRRKSNLFLDNKLEAVKAIKAEALFSVKVNSELRMKRKQISQCRKTILRLYTNGYTKTV